MTVQTINMDAAPAKWAETFDRREQAEAVYEEIRAASAPLFALTTAFEERNGLVPPRPGQPAASDYFEKRQALFLAHPHYRTPDEVSDNLEKLVEVICEIETELMLLPAPDLKALHWKLCHTAGACWEGWYLEQMRADMDRLLVDA